MIIAYDIEENTWETVGDMSYWDFGSFCCNGWGIDSSDQVITGY